MFGNTASKSMTGAAELYIRNTKPREEPVKLSPGTKEGIRQVHNVSTKGVKVTKKTLDTVNNVSQLECACSGAHAFLHRRSEGSLKRPRIAGMGDTTRHRRCGRPIIRTGSAHRPRPSIRLVPRRHRTPKNQEISASTPRPRRDTLNLRRLHPCRSAKGPSVVPNHSRRVRALPRDRSGTGCFWRPR
jgi:hypothetical protein